MLKPETVQKIEAICQKLDKEDVSFILSMKAEIERLQEKVKKQQERISEYSWAASGGDRMGGGWTDREILDYQRGGW